RGQADDGYGRGGWPSGYAPWERALGPRPDRQTGPAPSRTSDLQALSIQGLACSSYCTERAKPPPPVENAARSTAAPGVERAARSVKLQGGAHVMKYVLLFADTKERARQWEAMPEAQRQAAYAPINQWFEQYGNNVTG